MASPLPVCVGVVAGTLVPDAVSGCREDSCGDVQRGAVGMGCQLLPPQQHGARRASLALLSTAGGGEHGGCYGGRSAARLEDWRTTGAAPVVVPDTATTASALLSGVVYCRKHDRGDRKYGRGGWGQRPRAVGGRRPWRQRTPRSDAEAGAAVAGRLLGTPGRGRGGESERIARPGRGSGRGACPSLHYGCGVRGAGGDTGCSGLLLPPPHRVPEKVCDTRSCLSPYPDRARPANLGRTAATAYAGRVLGGTLCRPIVDTRRGQFSY